MGTNGAIPLDNVTGLILSRVISTATYTHRPPPRPTKSENGTKSCELPEHQGVAGFDVSEGSTHDLREDDGGDA
ncbi:hypothetical protein LINGRAHAP2_LOCUS31861 [Linum grandiflorum]